MTIGSLQQRRDLALSSGAELFYDTRLEIFRGEGIYIGVAKMSVNFWCLSVRFIPKAAAELE